MFTQVKMTQKTIKIFINEIYSKAPKKIPNKQNRPILY